MFFPYRPDNPEGATHQLQLFGGIRIGSIAMVRVPLDAMEPVEEDDE
ncbi:hypothetical protein [Escherichia coli]|nr:hypothetical protein [Escherichia coli]MCQ1824197.1 hypothetical protein [Escherichia coli]MDF1071074.1 hypothetical protein [Escherichia coli]